MNLTCLYSLSQESYLEDVKRLLYLMLANLNRICYISFNKSGESVIEFCKENGIDTNKMVIIDLVSARFKKISSKNNIVYLEVKELKKELKNIIIIIKKFQCDSIIFDSLSTLPVYYQEQDFVQFAHELLVYTEAQHIITNLIVQKPDLQKPWISSLIPLVGNAREVKFGL